MIDWTSIIMGALGTGTIGGAAAAISNYKYRKENKKLKESEVDKAVVGVDADKADLMQKYNETIDRQLDNFNKQQAAFEKSMAEKDVIIEQQKKSIDQQQALIENYKSDLDEARKKIKEFEVIISENKRKVEGVQKEYSLVQKEYNLVKKQLEDVLQQLEESNGIKCTVLDCTLREPPRKNESA